VKATIERFGDHVEISERAADRRQFRWRILLCRY
jgi:hypothetical protein